MDREGNALALIPFWAKDAKVGLSKINAGVGTHQIDQAGGPGKGRLSFTSRLARRLILWCRFRAVAESSARIEATTARKCSVSDPLALAHPPG